VLVQIWLVVFLGPLIAMAVIVGLVKGAQVVLNSDALLSLLLSKPAAISLSVVLGGIGLGFLVAAVMLFQTSPPLGGLFFIILILNGGAVWRVWWQRRQAGKLNDFAYGTEGEDSAKRSMRD
jgi:hypothetical protein